MSLLLIIAHFLIATAVIDALHPSKEKEKEIIFL